MSDKPASLAAALAEFQRNLPRIVKGETARVRSDKGNYEYQYADLADVAAVVMPLLGAVGLSFAARPTLSGDRFILAYVLMHEMGDSLEGEYPLPSSGTPQQIGSAITYARRYALCSMVGVAPDKDDDGQADTQQWERADARRAPESSGRERDSDRQAKQADLPVTQAQHKRMHALWNELGYSGPANRDNRLTITAKILGMEAVATSAALSEKQAATIIAALEERKKAEQARAERAGATE